MHTRSLPTLTADEIDDLLYFTRVNEAQDLQQTTKGLAQKYECLPREVLEVCIDLETGNSTLHYCSANGFTDLLQVLLSFLKIEEESNPVADGRTAGSLLLSHQNTQGSTPLHWAAYNGHLEVVKVLVNAGADMWIKNSAGHLAMFEAERADKNEVVQYLLEAGGREVERTGTEGQPSAEDVAEVTNPEEGSSNGASQEGNVMDVDSNGPKTSG